MGRGFDSRYSHQFAKHITIPPKIDNSLSLCYYVVMNRLAPLVRNHPYYKEYDGDFRDTQHYLTDRAFDAVFGGIRRAVRSLGIGRASGKTIGIGRGYDDDTTTGGTSLEAQVAKQAAVAPTELQQK